MLNAIAIAVSARAIVAEWAEEERPEREYYTLAERKRKWARREAEERADAEWEEWASAWLRDPANRGSENYSDIYKEMYGVRPRW